MSSDEDYTCYGNALDPIDEDSIPRKKPITVEDQFAKDEQGRRRFHGAFTGGFSAGFYNSVGSMEGWQPTQFISSRTNRMGSKNQTIFDFMDQEDTGEHGICPISLQVKPSFDAKSSNVDESNLKKRRRLPTSDQRPAFDSWFIRDMLAPTRNTVGVMLLVKMGWKPGQGIGPRLSRREKKRQTRQQSSDVSKKVYGCCLPTEARYNSESSGSEEELDVELNNITFAPNDYEAYIVSPKQNVFGLGYCGINRKPVLSSKQSEFSVLTVAGKSIRGQAFGVSVFEDEDDDIYHKEDMSNYDFSLPYAGELKNIEPQRKSIPSKNKDCIEGFHISERSSSKIKRQSFVLPSIPADFQENRVKKNRWDSPIATGNVCKLKISSAPERSKLLETSNDDAQHNKDDHSDTNTIQISEIPLPEQTTTIVHNSNNQMAASDNSGNVKPFAYDVLKQSRYETFLKLKSSQQNTVADKTSNIYPSGMTEWEREREINEFEQTARLYRPLADELASRFTRGSQEENVHDIATPVEKSYNAESEVLRNASKNKNFGVLTRKKYPWKPDKVVCKRFNIPEPIDNLSCEASSATLISNQKDRMGSVFEFLKKSAYNTASISPVANITTPSTLVTEPMQPQPPSPLLSQPQTTSSNCNVIEQPQTQESNVNVAGDEDSENDDQIEKITDKIDLFKAIFLSSSDEENDKDDEPFENSKEAESSSSSYLDGSNSGLRHIETPPVTIMPRADKKEIRYSPARGIFANLDLESMKSKPSFQKKDDSVAIATSADIINSSPEVNAANANNASVYGPKIPSSLLSKASTSEIQRRLPRDCSPVQEVKSHHASTSVWVEKSDKHKMKKSKKSKKKQKKKKSRKEK